MARKRNSKDHAAAAASRLNEQVEQLKDDFISVVSHELRTPLSIAKEGINLILDGIPGPINAEQARVLKSVKINIDRLVRIINNLLDISKIEAGKLEIRKRLADVADLARQAASSYEAKAVEKKVSLKMDLPAEHFLANVDPDMVIQVITNLLDNAVKFTKEGQIKVSMRECGKHIECSVADTGMGISKEDMPKLFEKFQRFGRANGSSERGMGLGLSIAKRIVEMHGGRISAESEPGRGTKVTFTLPKKV